jgi:hypothetical protein
MKYLRKYRLFEAVECYKYVLNKTTDDITVYNFTDGTYKFRVEFDKNIEDGESEIQWFVWNGEKWTFDEVPTNIYSLTKTILGNILPEFLKNNDWCTSMLIRGHAKGKEKSEVTQRTMTYLRYLNGNPIPGWSLDSYINEIYLDKIEE